MASTGIDTLGNHNPHYQKKNPFQEVGHWEVYLQQCAHYSYTIGQITPSLLSMVSWMEVADCMEGQIQEQTLTRMEAKARYGEQAAEESKQMIRDRHTYQKSLIVVSPPIQVQKVLQFWWQASGLILFNITTLTTTKPHFKRRGRVGNMCTCTLQDLTRDVSCLARSLPTTTLYTHL